MEQLMPLVKQLDRVQELEVPDFGTLAAREVETKTVIINPAQVVLMSFFKRMQLQAQIDGANCHVEELKRVKQYVNSSNKESKMDVTSDPSVNKNNSQEQLIPLVKLMQDRAQIDAANRHAEEMKLILQYVNSSNKRSKMDMTSDPFDNKKSNQEQSMPLVKQMQGREQIDAAKRHAEEMKLVLQYFNSSNKRSKMGITSDPSDNKKSGQIDVVTSCHVENLKRIKQCIDLSKKKSKTKVTSDFSDNEGSSQEVQQGQETKMQQDPSTVHNLYQPTSSDSQLGMKRKHGVENIKEVTTPGISEEYYKVDLHLETGEDYDDDWELVEHNLILQFCGTL